MSLKFRILPPDIAEESDMSRLAMIAAGVALLATGGVASAQQDSERRAAQPEEEKEKKICRTDKATGSLTRRTRICMTRSQWNELAARTRKGIDEMTGSASGAPRCMSAMDVSCGAPGPGGVAPGG